MRLGAVMPSHRQILLCAMMVLAGATGLAQAQTAEFQKGSITVVAPTAAPTAKMTNATAHERVRATARAMAVAVLATDDAAGVAATAAVAVNQTALIVAVSAARRRLTPN